MGIGLSVFLIAVGAVLTFAIHVTTSGFNIHTIGVILMIAGVIGLLVDLAIFAPRRRSVTRVDDAYDAPVAGRTTTTRTDVY